jgi:Rrf2 family iron-sulfur cluster assembly transcriptional regulator
MQLSTKGRYAVMALADIAKQGADDIVNLATIAERQQISLAYLEQLFLKMRRAGLVASFRGPGGGYALNREAGDISIAEIMRAVDEPVKMTRCSGDQDLGCLGYERCLTHELWDALGRQIVSFLDGVSLGDVIDNHNARALLSEAAPGTLVPDPDGHSAEATK